MMDSRGLPAQYGVVLGLLDCTYDLSEWLLLLEGADVFLSMYKHWAHTDRFNERKDHRPLCFYLHGSAAGGDERARWRRDRR